MPGWTRDARSRPSPSTSSPFQSRRCRQPETVGADWPIAVEVDEPVEALGERDALRRVLDNLLLNVRTHTPEGTEATITLTRLGDLAVIEVADNGPGFAAEQAEELFARFFRGDSSRSRVHGGAGLGLSIVQAIVVAHGGRVSAHARSGGGAVFTVCLPAPDREQRPKAPPAAQRRSRRPTLRASSARRRADRDSQAIHGLVGIAPQNG